MQRNFIFHYADDSDFHTRIINFQRRTESLQPLIFISEFMIKRKKFILHCHKKTFMCIVINFIKVSH